MLDLIGVTVDKVWGDVRVGDQEDLPEPVVSNHPAGQGPAVTGQGIRVSASPLPYELVPGSPCIQEVAQPWSVPKT